MSTSTSVNYTAEAPAAQPAPSSLGSRFAKVFFSPGQLFQEFGENNSPWAGAILVVFGSVLLLQVIAFFGISDQVLLEYVKGQIADAGQPLPPDEVLAPGLKFGKMINVIIGPVATTLIAFFAALISWLAFTVVGGGKARYPQYLAVIAHALFISVVGAAIMMPIQIASGQLEMELSAGLVADRIWDLNPMHVTTNLLNKIEIFNLWTMAVAGIGIATINRSRQWIGYAAICFLLYVVFSVGIPTAIGLIMGGPGGGQPS